MLHVHSVDDDDDEAVVLLVVVVGVGIVLTSSSAGGGSMPSVISVVPWSHKVSSSYSTIHADRAHDVGDAVATIAVAIYATLM